MPAKLLEVVQAFMTMSVPSDDVLFVLDGVDDSRVIWLPSMDSLLEQ